MIRRLFRPWWVRWIVLPLAVLLAAHAGWVLALKWQFDGRIEELRASGAPVLLSDLRRPRIPDEDNAAALWEEAHRWYQANLLPKPEKLDGWVGDEWFEEEREEIAAWLARGDPYVDLLARAAARPDMWQDLNWEAGADMVMTAIPQMQESVTFLEYRVRFAESATPAALREIRVILDLAPKLERPLVICMLVRWTVEGVAAEALERLAAKPGFDASAARALLDPRLSATGHADHLREALAGERAVGLSLSRRWIGGESPFPFIQRTQVDVGEPIRERDLTLLNLVYGSWLARPHAYRDALRLLDLMERAIALVDLPPRDALPRAQSLRDEYFRGPPNVYSHLLATPPMLAFHQRLKHQAKMRIARVGLALLELRQTTGAWPETLDAVVPLVGEEWVEDPFTGGRLLYEPGVRIEAAVPIANEDLREDDEIVWRLPPFPPPHPLPR